MHVELWYDLEYIIMMLNYAIISFEHSLTSAALNNYATIGSFLPTSSNFMMPPLKFKLTKSCISHFVRGIGHFQVPFQVDIMILLTIRKSNGYT